MLINPNRPVSDFAGLRESFTTYEGELLEGTTEVDSHGQLVIRFADGGWAYSPIQYSTLTSPQASQVLAMIETDIRRGQYSGAGVLDSFTALHDHVDANEYLDSVVTEADGEGFDAWNDRVNALSDQVDAILRSDPIEV